MSVDTVSPARDGQELVGDRYRLCEVISHEATTTVWRAYDELLARPVALTEHSPGGPAATAFLEHANALSSIMHPALARVYDATAEDDRTYVVSEWVQGISLTDKLRAGPMETAEAASLVERIAEGVTAAHTSGVGIGGLHPDRLIFTERGVVIAHVATVGASVDEDIRSLGGLLYATLTGQWPLGDCGARLDSSALPSAGLVSGQLRSPNQVRGGVPYELSTLAMRALTPEQPDGIHTAEDIRLALSDLVNDDVDEHLPFPQETSLSLFEPTRQIELPPGVRSSAHSGRPRWLTAGIALASVGILLLGGLLVKAMVNGLRSDSGSAQTLSLSDKGGKNQAESRGKAVKPTDIRIFDPQGDATENIRKVPLAIDGKADTAWSTVDYRRTAAFGNLKEGEGLILDFGKPVNLRHVVISTTTPGIDLQIRAGDTATGNAHSYNVVGQAQNIQARTDISLHSSDSHRYWIIWLTKLAPEGNGQFHATLAEVEFSG